METDISASVTENPKKFWKFVRSKVKTKDRVTDLIKPTVSTENYLTKTDGEKARVG